jgi:signal transduction histidine kinase
MPEQEKVNILMVDDQPGKLVTYEAILSELDENLIKARSGKEALDHLLRTDIAVVLMDVSMPELDGFELADMIRQHPRFQKVAIIFISAVHLTDIDRLNAYQRGAVDYIAVPIVPELLRAKVRVFADLHRKTRQLEMLNRDLRSLSARLLAMQDEERRRIARDLHDGIGPLIAALSMNNGMLVQQTKNLGPEVADVLQQNNQLVEQLSKETRTISHLLHPPLLDEIGLLPAIKMFAEGFAERSSVKVAVDLSPDIGRLPPNVYRHSGSKTAQIKISHTPEKLLSVRVCDEGKGIVDTNGASTSSGSSHGVGLSGMRERLRELGGTLEIHSSENGTTVIAAVPVNKPMGKSA